MRENNITPHVGRVNIATRLHKIASGLALTPCLVGRTIEIFNAIYSQNRTLRVGLRLFLALLDRYYHIMQCCVNL